MALNAVKRSLFIYRNFFAETRGNLDSSLAFFNYVDFTWDMPKIGLLFKKAKIFASVKIEFTVQNRIIILPWYPTEYTASFLLRK